MHIGYDFRNGVAYAKLCTSHRVGAKTYKTYENLGRVLDAEKGIYKNRERGIFTYDLATDTYGRPPADYIPDLPQKGREELLLNFGDVYFLDQFLQKSGLNKVVDAVGYGNPDTLKSMICYYILCAKANCHAEDWWSGSFARILYPKANLSSQRISDFLAAIGDEYSQREFFAAYIPFLKNSGQDLSSILIDSTGLPNSIHFSLTAINRHNGKISNEVRLIYMVQQQTGMPIYYRYCPGNVIDANTVVRCVAELQEQGVTTKFVIMDAAYMVEENIDCFYDNEISFVSRLPDNRTLYKDIVRQHLSTIETRENMVSYNGRYVYLKRIPCQLYAHPAYAYLGLDLTRKSMEASRTFEQAASKKMSIDDVYNEIQNQGTFILISSDAIEPEKVLPLYYTRQQIEQVFDIGKNYADLLPIRVQEEETFRGHLLLTFVATTILRLIQEKLKTTSMNPISIFLNLGNQKCKVYPDKVITGEPVKKVNDCYKLFGIKCPATIKRPCN